MRSRRKTKRGSTSEECFEEIGNPQHAAPHGPPTDSSSPGYKSTDGQASCGDKSRGTPTRSGQKSNRNATEREESHRNTANSETTTSDSANGDHSRGDIPNREHPTRVPNRFAQFGTRSCRDAQERTPQDMGRRSIPDRSLASTPTAP